MRLRITTLLACGERSITVEEQPDGDETRLLIPIIGLASRRKFTVGFRVPWGDETGWYGSPEPVSLAKAWWLLQLLVKLDRLSVRPDLIGILADALDGNITEDGRQFAAEYFRLAPEAFMSLVSEVFLTRVPAAEACHILAQLPQAAIDEHLADIEYAIEAHQLEVTPRMNELLAPARKRHADAEDAYAEAASIIYAELAPELSLGQLLADLSITQLFTPFGPDFFWSELEIGVERLDWLVKSAGIGRHAIDGPLPLLAQLESPEAYDLQLEITTASGRSGLRNSVQVAGPILIDAGGHLTILHAAHFDGEEIWVKASLGREPDSELAIWENDDVVSISVPDLREHFSHALGLADAAPGTILRLPRRPRPRGRRVRTTRSML